MCDMSLLACESTKGAIVCNTPQPAHRAGTPASTIYSYVVTPLKIEYIRSYKLKQKLLTYNISKAYTYGTPHKKVYVSYLTLSVVRYEVRTILAYFLLTLVRS